MSSRSASPSREPARKPAAAGRGGLAVPRRALAGIASFMARRPAAVLAVAVVGGGASLICWNALMTQSGRHPAPLFPPARPAVAAAMPPAEPPRRPTVTTTASVVPAVAARPEAGPGAGRQAAAEPGRGQANDPIGALLKPEAPGKPDLKPAPASSARAAEAKPAPAASPRLVSAQKALAKLGYGPIGHDGVMGSTTRRAIERFEKDKGLPVTGALGSRTSKKLASASGMSLN